MCVTLFFFFTAPPLDLNPYPDLAHQNPEAAAYSGIVHDELGCHDTNNSAANDEIVRKRINLAHWREPVGSPSALPKKALLWPSWPHHPQLFVAVVVVCVVVLDVYRSILLRLCCFLSSWWCFSILQGSVSCQCSAMDCNSRIPFLFIIVYFYII